MDEIVKRYSLFLRKGCHIPAHFDLARQPGADNWMSLEEIEAPEFNAAKLESVKVSTYPVFQIARVAVQPHSSLEMTVEDYPRTLSAR